MGVLGFVCTQYPDIQLSIIFLPMFTFTAGIVRIYIYIFIFYFQIFICVIVKCMQINERITITVYFHIRCMYVQQFTRKYQI